MRDVLQPLVESLNAGRELVLCQVVETKGSTPQKAGALMIIDPSGGQIGTLGGGCVEAEVKQKAIRRLGQAGAELHTFVLDHDQAWADGLVCGGKMTILAEALRPEAALEYFQAYVQALGRGQKMIEAVGLASDDSGKRWLLDGAGQCIAGYRVRSEHAPTPPPDVVNKRTRPCVQDSVAFLPILPRIRLVIVGAGHVGQAVAELAARVDFDVWAIDDRAQFACKERFPAAERLIVGPIDEALRGLEVDASTYFLIVTRGHGHDQEALEIAAVTAATYVGLIGSKRKIRIILEALRDKGISEEALTRVTAPVGLDIGSESVAEIAVSIVAQLIAVRNQGPDRT